MMKRKFKAYEDLFGPLLFKDYGIDEVSDTPIVTLLFWCSL